MKTEDYIYAAVEAADLHKGEHICALSVEKASQVTDYYLILTGRNRMHTKALAREIDKALHALGRDYMRSEGMREGTWILLDYGDFVVQIFDPETRTYYDLDGLWGDMPQLDLKDYVTAAEA